MQGKHWSIIVDKNKTAFTLVELLVSIVISVILLWGIFYFMTETILWISQASAQARFLKEFYTFSSLLDQWNFKIVQNYPFEGWYDVGLLINVEQTRWILIWVIDVNTKRLIGSGSFDIYTQSALAYKEILQTDVNAIIANPNLVYSYEFFSNKTFQNFFLKNFQIETFNSGSLTPITEMYMQIAPTYFPERQWKNWDMYSREDLFEYSLSF